MRFLLIKGISFSKVSFGHGIRYKKTCINSIMNSMVFHRYYSTPPKAILANRLLINSLCKTLTRTLISKSQTVYDKDSKSEVLVWFQLVDSLTGEAYKRVTADKVRLPSSADVADLRDAVKAEYNDSHLQGIAASNLIVYENKAAFDKRNAQEGKVLYLNN